MPSEKITKTKKQISSKNKTKKNTQPKYSFYIVDGTSSAGKSTICNYFANFDYKCIKVDDIFENHRKELDNIYIGIMKKIKNKYDEKEKQKVNQIAEEIMVNMATKEQKAILDDISQQELLEIFTRRNLMKYVKIIVVYTNLANLARNLESRRKEGDPRGKFAFEQFADRYIKADPNDKDIIDYINKSDFIKLLKKYFKYEFKNQEDLLKFADSLFENMNIKDNQKHPIKLKASYKADIIINTTNKTKQQIFEELEHKLH